MTLLALHEFHHALNARFTEVNGMEVVRHYGDPRLEYTALRQSAGVLDLSFRGRICLTGADRQRFLHGQVTNNILDLDTGEGCYAALVTAKGKMESDLNVYCLPEEILLDFEPGLTRAVSDRLKKYIIADDVQVVEVEPEHGLLSVQGPQSAAVLQRLGLDLPLPSQLMTVTQTAQPTLGDIYCINQPRGATLGFDLLVATPALAAVADRLLAAAKAIGGCAGGWDALETVRLEAGIPRFGADMDETNLPPETGIEKRAVSFTKGCYIGQEIIARIRTYGQVARALRGLRLADTLHVLPRKGDQLRVGDKEVGAITSAVTSPGLKANIALGYVRREHNQVGTELELATSAGRSRAQIVSLPFTNEAEAGSRIGS